MSVLGHICTAGEVVFIHSDQVDKTCPSTLILTLYQSLLIQYLRGDMESIYTDLALYVSKIECARTDNVVFPISEICKGTVSLKKIQSGKTLCF